MIIPKCAFCKKRFKKSDYVMIVDGNVKEPVHEECHYDYISHFHLNSTYSFDEFKEILEEEE